MMLYTTRGKKYDFIVAHTWYTDRLYRDDNKAQILKDETSYRELKPIFSYRKLYNSDEYSLDRFPGIRKSKEHNKILDMLKKDGLDINGIIVFKHRITEAKLSYSKVEDIYDALKNTDYCAMYGIEDLTFAENYIYIDVASESG